MEYLTLAFTDSLIAAVDFAKKGNSQLEPAYAFPLNLDALPWVEEQDTSFLRIRFREESWHYCANECLKYESNNPADHLLTFRDRCPLDRENIDGIFLYFQV